jgi:hypothetical protein
LDRFTPDEEKSIALEKTQDHQSPVPAFLSAFLTSKTLYHVITSFTFNGLTFVETLQRYQNQSLARYIDQLEWIDINGASIQDFRDVFGRFGKTGMSPGDVTHRQSD